MNAKHTICLLALVASIFQSTKLQANPLDELVKDVFQKVKQDLLDSVSSSERRIVRTVRLDIIDAPFPFQAGAFQTGVPVIRVGRPFIIGELGYLSELQVLNTLKLTKSSFFGEYLMYLNTAVAYETVRSPSELAGLERTGKVELQSDFARSLEIGTHTECMAHIFFHEFAHIVNRHSVGRISPIRSRKQEREADQWALSKSVQTGHYPVATLPLLFKMALSELNNMSKQSISHPHPFERAQMIARELPDIVSKISERHPDAVNPELRQAAAGASATLSKLFKEAKTRSEYSSQEWLSAAKENDVEAILMTCQDYSDGARGFPLNRDEAIKWALRGCKLVTPEHIHTHSVG